MIKHKEVRNKLDTLRKGYIELTYNKEEEVDYLFEVVDIAINYISQQEKKDELLNKIISIIEKEAPQFHDETRYQDYWEKCLLKIATLLDVKPKKVH